MWKRNTVGGDIVIASYNSRNRTVSDRHLSEIFSVVGERYGFSDVGAEFSAFTDFKVRWQRSSDWIRFQVSDYLDRAPDDVLTNLADVLFSKMRGDDRDYDEVFIKYVTGKKVAGDNRKDFLSRSRNLNDTCIGQYHDLNDCVDRLRDQGLLPDDLECELRWDDTKGGKASGCSVLQRVVWVNRVLDQKGIPENVLDYAVYAMFCHLMIGFPGNRRDDEYARLVAYYPARAEAEDWMARHDLYL